MSQALGLELDKVTAGYGKLPVLREVSARIAGGEITVLLGHNGAGKSTLAKAIMGLVPRCRGRVEFDGRDLIGRRPEDRIRAGIAYVPQVENVFPSLTVLENLLVVEGIKDRRARAAEMFDLFPALAERRRVRAEVLSGGERQQLAFARALMSRPKMMLLDEPTAALSPSLAGQVFQHIKRLPALGVAALIIEQRARQSLEISDRGYVLDAGRAVMDGPADRLLADPQMTDLYLGAA